MGIIDFLKKSKEKYDNYQADNLAKQKIKLKSEIESLKLVSEKEKLKTKIADNKSKQIKIANSTPKKEYPNVFGSQNFKF